MGLSGMWDWWEGGNRVRDGGMGIGEAGAFGRTQKVNKLKKLKKLKKYTFLRTFFPQ
jgi:hypothetical protein